MCIPHVINTEAILVIFAGVHGLFCTCQTYRILPVVFCMYRNLLGVFCTSAIFAKSKLFASTFCVRTQVLLDENSSKLICDIFTLYWTYLPSFVKLQRTTAPLFPLKDRRRWSQIGHVKTYKKLPVENYLSRFCTYRKIPVRFWRTEKSLYACKDDQNGNTEQLLTFNVIMYKGLNYGLYLLLSL